MRLRRLVGGSSLAFGLVTKPPESFARGFYLEIEAAAVVQGFTHPSMLALQSGQPIEGLAGTH